MKKLIYIFAIAIGIMFTACEKDSVNTHQVISAYDYNSQINQNRVALAEILIESMMTYDNLASTIINECHKQFDGDRDVLCMDIVEKVIYEKQNTKVGNLIDNYSKSRKVKSFDGVDNTIDSILKQDSLLQIYFYVAGNRDSTDFEGIVIEPEDYV